MNKLVSVAAILALSAASNEFADLELINLHLEQPRLHRPTFSPLVRDFAHDDEQMIRLQPEIFKPHYRTFTPLVADDNDDELVYASALRLDDNDDQYFVAPGLVADDEFYVDDEFFVEQADNELNFFKKIGNGLKKAGQFVVSHPQIITTAAKFLDDNDDEFVYASALRADDYDDQYFAADDEFYADEQDDEFYAEDDEFFVDEQADHELNFFKKIGNGLKKAGQFVVSHPQIITTAAKFLDDNDDEFYAEDDEFFVDEQADHELNFYKKIGNGKYIEQKPVTQDSLSSLGNLLKEGKKVQLPKRPVKIQEVQDNNLSFKDKLKGAANWIGDHPQVITEAAKTYKTLRGGKH